MLQVFGQGTKIEKIVVTTKTGTSLILRTWPWIGPTPCPTTEMLAALASPGGIAEMQTAMMQSKLKAAEPRLTTKVGVDV